MRRMKTSNPEKLKIPDPGPHKCSKNLQGWKVLAFKGPTPVSDATMTPGSSYFFFLQVFFKPANVLPRNNIRSSICSIWSRKFWLGGRTAAPPLSPRCRSEHPRPCVYGRPFVDQQPVFYFLFFYSEVECRSCLPARNAVGPSAVSGLSGPAAAATPEDWNRPPLPPSRPRSPASTFSGFFPENSGVAGTSGERRPAAPLRKHRHRLRGRKFPINS